MEKHVSIPNISCGHCVATIEREIGELAGVAAVQASAETKQATFRFEAPATWESIASTLEEIGYPAAGEV